jgi:hypothetical protein
MFLSESRLKEAYDQSQTRMDHAPAWLKSLEVSLPGVLKATFASPDLEQKRRLDKEFRRVCEQLKEDGELGTLDEPRKYLYGRYPAYYQAFGMVNPSVLYLVGETDRTIVALGGRLRDMVGRTEDEAKSEEGARLVVSEWDVAGAIADAQRAEDMREAGLDTPAPPHPWHVNVLSTYQRFGYYPDRFPKTMVETLAWCEAFVAASEVPADLPAAKNVLLGRPIFIAYA